MSTSISLYLDARKSAFDSPAPVKLRLYLNRETIRHYSTEIYLTKDDFDASYLALRPRGNFKDVKAKLEAIASKANEIITRLGTRFTFERFEREMFRSNYPKCTHCKGRNKSGPHP
ncbi:MAG: hypothetical protein INR69_06760 [Mucilaginibacter polytrichastri]|nr:hypothetical protein [Mucilaginibacter polytrichastri]